MLNIASVNMPKIKPETKVLIIKTLKSKSWCPSLLKLQTSSMCLNGRWRGFASATKRLVTSMTDPGRADHTRQLLEMTACRSNCQKPGPCQPRHSSRDARFVKNCMSDSCSQWSEGKRIVKTQAESKKQRQIGRSTKGQAGVVNRNQNKSQKPRIRIADEQKWLGKLVIKNKGWHKLISISTGLNWIGTEEMINVLTAWEYSDWSINTLGRLTSYAGHRVWGGTKQSIRESKHMGNN